MTAGFCLFSGEDYKNSELIELAFIETTHFIWLVMRNAFTSFLNPIMLISKNSDALHHLLDNVLIRFGPKLFRKSRYSNGYLFCPSCCSLFLLCYMKETSCYLYLTMISIYFMLS